VSNKRLPVSGFSDYCIDVSNHRIYNKHGNLIKPMIDSKGRSCVRMVDDEGKRKTLVLATITRKLGGIRSEREENTVTLLKSYYHLIHEISDLKDNFYWMSVLTNSNPMIGKMEVAYFLGVIRPNNRLP
jgi:hypothetical protein